MYVRNGSVVGNNIKPCHGIWLSCGLQIKLYDECTTNEISVCIGLHPTAVRGSGPLRGVIKIQFLCLHCVGFIWWLNAANQDGVPVFVYTCLRRPMNLLLFAAFACNWSCPENADADIHVHCTNVTLWGYIKAHQELYTMPCWQALYMCIVLENSFLENNFMSLFLGLWYKVLSLKCSPPGFELCTVYVPTGWVIHVHVSCNFEGMCTVIHTMCVVIHWPHINMASFTARFFMSQASSALEAQVSEEILPCLHSVSKHCTAHCHPYIFLLFHLLHHIGPTWSQELGAGMHADSLSSTTTKIWCPLRPGPDHVIVIANWLCTSGPLHLWVLFT